MMLTPDYHLHFTFGHQIRFRSVSSDIENVQKYRVVLGFMKRARSGLRVENYDPVSTLHAIMSIEPKTVDKAVKRLEKW